MAVLLLLAASTAMAADEWKVEKSEHFVVRYQHDPAFATQVARTAEEAYDRITRELDFTRYGGFWLWDKRVRIDVYPQRDRYLQQTHAPPWSGGKADYVGRTITTFEGSQAFLQSILPHEMTHLIFREFIGFRSGIPLWLDEGVAQWEDRSTRAKVAEITAQLYQQHRLLSLAALTGTDIRRASGMDAAAGFYAQSASLVGFMIETYGAQRFREFCGHLRDGKSVDDALRFTYPQTIRSLEGLESAWLGHLEVSPQ
jgi:hypothetical protein